MAISMHYNQRGIRPLVSREYTAVALQFSANQNLGTSVS